MNIAKVIQFPQQQASKPSTAVRKSMYSDKFQQGYVMSSLLYRKEVYPFLSDAARNVYAELENRINGYNKESDFVSYSQLQGGELPGSRLMSRPTVSMGLKELLKLGVVTVMSSGKQGMKSYQINEISLRDRFSNETGVVSKPVQQVNQDRFTNETATGVVTTHTIDNSLDIDIKKEKSFLVDNFNSELFSNSVEYHLEDKKEYSLRELANVYTIKTDFTEQAKKLNSGLSEESIVTEIKNFAQWSITREKTTAQGWMNYWIYRIQKSSQPKTKTTAPTPKQPPVRKQMTDAQINMFSKKLCNHDDFASTYSNVGETQKQFEGRIALDLRDQNKVKAWSSYLHDVGFAGDLEEFTV